MKNIIDTWLKADQLTEGMHLMRRGETGECAHIVSIEKDGNGNLEVFDSDFNRAMLHDYHKSWSFAPLEIR